MEDKKKLIDAYFSRHKTEWKTKIHQELKAVVSIHKFFKPSSVYKMDRLDDTPTGEKTPRTPG